MNQEHLTKAELIGVLYETAPANAHLSACDQCRGELAALETRQLASAEADGARQNVSASKLAAQRSHIYARLDSRPFAASRWLWAGAPLAAAAVLLFTMNPGVFHGTPVEKQTVAEVGGATTVESSAAAAGYDDTLYTDIYQTLSLGAPEGVYTVAGMFDVAEVTAQKSEE